MLDCIAYKKKEANSYIILHSFTQFYNLLHTFTYFINCPAFVDIKRTLH